MLVKGDRKRNRQKKRKKQNNNNKKQQQPSHSNFSGIKQANFLEYVLWKFLRGAYIKSVCLSVRLSLSCQSHQSWYLSKTKYIHSL